MLESSFYWVKSLRELCNEITEDLVGIRQSWIWMHILFLISKNHFVGFRGPLKWIFLQNLKIDYFFTTTNFSLNNYGRCKIIKSLLTLVIPSCLSAAFKVAGWISNNGIEDPNCNKINVKLQPKCLQFAVAVCPCVMLIFTQFVWMKWVC